MNVLARLVVCALPLVGLVGGCSNQGEGERCDVNAADCETGLVCQIPIAAPYYGVCCPPPPAQSTAPACNPGIIPPEAGSDAADAEAGPEASPEAEVGEEPSVDVSVDSSDGAATEEASPDGTAE
jgi:hypothetical protein